MKDEFDFDFPKIPPLKMDATGMGYAYTHTEVEVTRALSGGGDSSALDFPFKVTLVTENNITKYVVSVGSITDGTNGASIPLAGIFNEKRVASTGYVVIKANINTSLEHSGWGVAIQSDTDEVLLAGTPLAQTEVRLLLGRIISSGSPPVLSVNTAISTSQRLTHGFLNGALVRVFESAPTHPDNL